MPGGIPQPHVLAIDATPEILDLYRELFDFEGYRVSTWQDPPSDLGEIARLAPDCVLMDCMRTGDDRGLAWLQRLRADPRTAAIPAVVCTGAWDKVDERTKRLASLGVGFVPKPFDVEELLLVIRRCIDRADGADQPSAPLTPRAQPVPHSGLA